MHYQGERACVCCVTCRKVCVSFACFPCKRRPPTTWHSDKALGKRGPIRAGAGSDDQQLAAVSCCAQCRRSEGAALVGKMGATLFSVWRQRRSTRPQDLTPPSRPERRWGARPLSGIHIGH